MDFSVGVRGWSEKLWLAAADLSSSLLSAQTLIGYRLAILSIDCSLDYARISTVGPPRDRHKIRFDTSDAAKYPGVIVAPALVPPDGELSVNDPENCVQVELENQDGQWATRFIHGIPDAFVVANQLTSVITPATVLPPDVGDGTFSTNWFTRAGYYLNRIKALSVMGQKKFIGGAWVFNTDTIYACESGGLTRHKVGRPFGLQRGRVVPH